MGEDTDGRRKRLLSKPKHPKHSADTVTSRPLAPVTNATTAESPQRKRGIGSVRFRKKVKPSAEAVNLRPNLGSELSLSDSVDIDISASALNAPSIPSNGFEPRDRFAIRRGMMHHPYPLTDAPYMQAYDRTLMDNDRFFEMLLRRLNPNQSPSFLAFEQDHPRSILDLGCGPGLWAMEAAAFWPNALVIGFDLVHPARLNSDATIPTNLQWRQGNFVKYKLPFPKETFDFVRMANLSLCVPADSWNHVFSEVRRVLAPGGRLELIDDHIHFPYSKNTRQQSASPQIIPRQIRSSSFPDDDDDDNLTQRGDTTNSDGDDSDDDFKSTKSRFSALVEPDPVPPDVPYDPVMDWNRKVEQSKNIEQVFENMLIQKFNIIPRPREQIQDALQQVFGRYNLHKEKEFWLFLAPAFDKDSDNASVGSSESSSSGASGGVKKVGKDLVQWVTTDKKDKKDKDRKKGDRFSGESLASFTQIPETISAKAAGRLGIVPSPPRQHLFGQSPGLVVNLQTFIPLSAFELEMHACKHIHTLLGCKAAIHEYLNEISNGSQAPVPEDLIDDLLWEYECFRRKRFHWPAEAPEYQLDAPAVETPKSASHRHSLDGPWRQRAPSVTSSPLKAGLYSPGDLDLVRSIQVFSAKKVDDEFLPLM
ncbi:hypothetical protein J3A83DRAFT_4093894 [Scleroderma citrinum]